MSALFSKQKLPPIPEPVEDEEAARNVATQGRLRRFRSARASTILGGASTLESDAGFATKQLLGG